MLLQLYGTTHPNSYGCNRGNGGAGKMPGQPTWHSEDNWNGYNRQGSLDLSLMILDHYAATGESAYLGIPVGVVAFYSNLWSNTSAGPGKPMRFFPTQAVETWQCPGWPVDPTNCPSNGEFCSWLYALLGSLLTAPPDMPTVAGLHAVLQKLLLNPPPVTPAATLARWKDMQGRLPPLPQIDSTMVPCSDCFRPSTPAGPVNCTAWKCSCQQMTDMYGSEAGIGFGCAPKDAQLWWSKVKHCGTKMPSRPCAKPPAAGCGSGVEKTHCGCCPACAGAGPPPPPPPAKPGCHHTSNSEDAELYCLHPYRMASRARGDAAALAAATRAFNSPNLVSKNDVGWNQLAMDAALMGNASKAANYVMARAKTAPAAGYRFPTMAPHEQDYEPSSDHFGVMQAAVT